LILSGANPVFMMLEYDERLGIAHGVTVETIANHLVSNPKIKAVLIVNPTYYGVCSDVVKIANLIHQYNLPLIVDEAHGAHFQFHPALPTAALTADADIVIQSTHKTLSALTQASMLQIKGDRVSADRLAKSLQLVQSTSPSYLLLASLDIARMQMATQGELLLGEAIDRMKRVRSEINKIPNIRTLEFTNSPGFHELDPLRLTVLIDGMNGFTADEILHEELGITCELPGLQSLTFIATHGTTDEDCDRLLTGLQQLSDRILEPCNNSINDESNYEIFTEIPIIVLSPRDAFFAKSKLVTVNDAIGQISADLICPYPPGIPIIMPGEQITETTIAYLQQILAAGGMLTGCADSDLQIMRVIDN
jgi:arginine decarboxylase